ncbi:MAG: substrate-binding domain-containing protein, partial [Acidimicrobiia bacterium]|nr:substrate-binding domain-containing protein [Acidimicrobiia bacterium]
SSGAYTVTVFQCKGAVPTSMADCYQNFRPPAGDDLGTGIYDATTTADGTGSTFFEVRPAEALPELDCKSSNPCSILAFENDGNPLPTSGLPASAVTAPLQFAPSPSDCPEVASPDVRTEGSASTAHALYEWAAKTCTAHPSLSIDYTESASPAGRRDFLNGSVEVGLTSTPATSAELAAAPGHRSFAYAPLDVSGVAVAFNVTDTVTHQRITDMNLTPRLVAILISGSGLHLFQDPEFQALNPGHNWPMEVQPPLLRGERNADALLLTTWLQEDPAARAFLDGHDPDAEVDTYWKGVQYPTDIFEARDPNTIGNYNPRTGTLINARRLFNFQAPGDGVSVSAQNDGILAVTDVVTAARFGQPVAKLRRAGGGGSDPFVAPDQAGLTAGLAAMKVNTDGVTKSPDVTTTTGYPLVKVDYAMVPTSGTDKVAAGKLSQFLTFAAGEGQADVQTAGYLPMPTDLQSQATSAAAKVVAAASGSTTPPPPTPPSTLPPPVESQIPFTSPGGGDGGSFSSGDVPTSPDAPPSAAPTGGGKEPTSAKVTGPAAVFASLAGSGHRLILPIVLVVGLAAAVVGGLFSPRRRRRKGGAAATAASPSP